jgi:hypothetical protein
MSKSSVSLQKVEPCKMCRTVKNHGSSSAGGLAQGMGESILSAADIMSFGLNALLKE